MVKNFRKQLKKYIRILKKEFRTRKYADKFLRENFFIIENHFESALSENLPRDIESDSEFLLQLCRKIIKDGILPDDSKITEFIKMYSLSTAEISALAFFFRISLLIITSESIKNDRRIFRNAVLSLQKLQNTDFESILHETSASEQILKNDPAGIYIHMSEDTKQKYRIAICKSAEKKGITEADEAKNVLHNAIHADKHIGFFISFDKPDNKKGLFILKQETVIPLAATVTVSALLNAWYLLPVIYLPLRECGKYISSLLISATKKPQSLMSMDFGDSIPSSEKTVIAISVILPTADNTKELSDHLRQLYLSNCKENVCICILADLRTSKFPEESSDKADIDAMKNAVSELNLNYNDSFILAIRNRRYSVTEKEYTGHERKRGAMISLVKLIKNEKHEFNIIFGDVSKLHNAKYIMALDSDTRMPAGSLSKLLSIASHPLNRPVINTSTGKVIQGYGIIVPSMCTGIKQSAVSYFTSLMCGNCGPDAYSHVTGEKNQLIFDESFFCGKGLIDVNAFHQLLCNRFPHEQILSHDIPEGIILRSAFAGNIVLTDSFPSNKKSFLNRQHRWIRGDFQNLSLLTDKNFSQVFTPPYNYWIIDNVIRSLTCISSYICIYLSLFMPKKTAVATVAVALTSIILPDFISGLSGYLHCGFSLLTRRFFSSAVTDSLNSLLRCAVKLIMLPTEAYNNADALLRAFFRLTVSRRHLMQWTTAADSEKNKNNQISWFSVISGMILLLSGKPLHGIIGLIFLSDIPFSLLSSKKKTTDRYNLSFSEKDTLISYCRDMWKFYEDYCTAENNYLIPDNIQEKPVFNVAKRTSPTNIGLMLCVFLAARDLKFINSRQMYMRISHALDTIERLPLYKGNLYNWYNIEKMQVMAPEFISSVDSGNFLCCLTALKEGLKEYSDEFPRIRILIDRINVIIDNCDFGFLYCEKRNLFHTGFDTKTSEFTDSYFDLLMSESRMASYFAVAKNHAPVKHWATLGRPLSSDGRYTGTISWSGTMFEYLMPALFIPGIPGTLTYEAEKFCIFAQKRHVRKTDIPYGISESCCYDFDDEANYQYKAHGIRKLCMRNDPFDATVISPYSTFLTLPSDPHNGMKNLEKLKELGAYGKYGFYEAVDFPSDKKGVQLYRIVSSYMSHHTGMSFLAAVNCIFDNIMQKRFMNDEMMQGKHSLLEEKIPSDSKVCKKTPCNPD